MFKSSLHAYSWTGVYWFIQFCGYVTAIVLYFYSLYIRYFHVYTSLSTSDKEDTNNNVDSSEEETAQEKRLRLAKEYLVQLENEG
jgi:hypothetical protein